MNDWRNQANCIGAEFIYDAAADGDQYAEVKAKKICQGCPVALQCLNLALDHEGTVTTSSRFGVFGGLNPTERYRIYRGRSAFKPAECGTDSGYYRHKRTDKDEPCDPCKEAHREAWHRQKESRLAREAS